MPIEITMPKLSDTMAEGTILQWRIKEGDRVKKGQVIAEVETDKAAMEMEAFDEGVVQELRVEEGETVAVGTVIAVLAAGGEAAGEKKEAPPPQKAEAGEKRAAEERKKEEKEEKGKQEKAAAEKGERKEEEKEAAILPRGVSASPAARRLAREKGVDLGQVRGTGPGGRIVLADVEQAVAARAPAAGEKPPARAPGRKAAGVRRAMARKMAEAWASIPHFFVTVSVDMTDVIRIRRDLDASINDFVIAAAVHALREHPEVNSHWVDGEPVPQEAVNIAVAVATERGLYNPVLKDCGALTLREIGRRAKELADKARQGRLAPEDLEGGTFTISNMGMLDVESFSAIITPPQAAVLAVGTIRGEVVVDDHGESAIAPILRLTLSADHRILDGADAAEFLGTLKSYLEAPVTLIACDGKE